VLADRGGQCELNRPINRLPDTDLARAIGIHSSVVLCKRIAIDGNHRAGFHAMQTADDKSKRPRILAAVPVVGAFRTAALSSAAVNHIAAEFGYLRSASGKGTNPTLVLNAHPRLMDQNQFVHQGPDAFSPELSHNLGRKQPLG